MPIRSGPLTEFQLQGEIEFIRRFFGQHAIDPVVVAFGWGCNLTFDEMWQNRAVPLAELPALLQARQREGIFHLGLSDVSIAAADDRMRFLLCHEGDVHFEGGTVPVAQVAAHWRGEGWGVEEE